MTETLHTRLVSTLTAAGVNPALSEDEIDSYPYVTFELPVEYRYNKDGVYKIVGNLTIRSVSDDFDEADALRVSIEEAVAAGFDGTPVYPEETTEVPESDDEEEAVADEVLEPEPEDPAVPEEEEDPGTEEEPATGFTIYTARLTDVRKDCTDGVWVIELDYILNQSE